MRYWKAETNQTEREKNVLQKKIERHNARMDACHSKKEAICNRIKKHAERKKVAEDEIGFYVATVQSFETDFNSIGETVSSRINEVRKHFLQNLEEDIHLDRTTVSTQEIASCITEMNSLIEEISSFQEEVETCVIKLTINKLAGETCRQAITHHFDDTGEFEYRGSTYNHFHQQGIILLLTLAHLIMNEQEIVTEYQRWYQTISTRMNKLGRFPNTSAENEMLKILISKVNSFFDPSFEELVRKVAF